MSRSPSSQFGLHLDKVEMASSSPPLVCLLVHLRLECPLEGGAPVLHNVVLGEISTLPIVDEPWELCTAVGGGNAFLSSRDRLVWRSSLFKAGLYASPADGKLFVTSPNGRCEWLQDLATERLRCAVRMGPEEVDCVVFRSAREGCHAFGLSRASTGRRDSGCIRALAACG